MKTVAIYCRVSTENQETEGTSLPTQRTACLKYCQEHGYQVTHQFIETYSGLTLERPKLDELRQLVRNEEIGGVVIYCLDRLTRNATHGVILTEELEKHNVRLEAVTEDIDTSELGKLISYVKGYAAGLEAEKLRERTGRGIRSRVFDKNKPVTYRSPYGYEWEKDKNNEYVMPGRLLPNDDYQTVKLIFDWALDGKSYDWIIAELKRLAIPRPSGPRPKDNDITWNKHTISVIIRNPEYAGMYHAFKSAAVKPLKKNGNSKSTKVKSSVKRLPQSEWHHIPEIQVINPPITPDQRAFLLDQIEKRKKYSSRSAKRNYILRGMIYCETHKGVNGDPRVYHGQPHHNEHRYTCPVGKCENAHIPGEWADEIARTMIINLFIITPDEFYKQLLGSEQKRDFQAEQTRLENEHEKIINKIAMLENDRYDNKIDPDTYQRLNTLYKTQKQGVEARREALLDEINQLKHKEKVIESWHELKGKFIAKLRPAGEAEIEDFEFLLNLITNNQGKETDIKNMATRLYEKQKTLPDPLSDIEFRELLIASGFRWTIHEKEVDRTGKFRGKGNKFKILRHSTFTFELPVKPEIVRNVVSQAPGRG